tara:strand:- start:1850 stop:2116 length:267 start_codon:yes stop_codon:yes gene_type:complete
MIDTDKYEEFENAMNEGRIERVHCLWALAEVKRLREQLESIQNDMAWTVQVWQNENYMGRQDWMEQMCEIYYDLAKGVEAQYHGDEEE